MAKVEIVKKHAASTTGEGPHWDETTQSLLYVDIVASGIHQWNPETNEEKHVKMPGELIRPMKVHN